MNTQTKPSAEAAQHPAAGYNYLVSFGGGIGPDVWDKEIELNAIDIADAISQAQERVEDFGGWIFAVSQNDYPPPARDRLENDLEKTKRQRDELLAACKTALKNHEDEIKSGGQSCLDDDVLRAAIALAEKGYL